MMFNYTSFDEVFNFDPECSYDEIAIQGIDERRKKLEGLFFEKVLKLLGIKRRELTLSALTLRGILTLDSYQTVPTKVKWRSEKSSPGYR
jgi:hypothetical protein